MAADRPGTAGEAPVASSPDDVRNVVLVGHTGAGKTTLVEALLAQYGIEPGRFHWGWISGAEAPKWARLVRDFTEQVRALGPLDYADVVTMKTKPAAGHRHKP